MADGFSLAPILENAALQYLVNAVNQAVGSQLLTIHVDSGLSLAVAPPGEPTFALDNLQFGSGGVSGHLHIDGLDTNPLSVQLFGGFTVALTAFDLVMANGAFVSTHIGGQLTIPYFTNADGSSETVGIEVTIRSDGSLAVTLAAVQIGATTPDGLVDLNYSLPANNGIELMIASLEVTRSASGVWQINISGSLQIETVDIQWPKFDLNGLQIDSQGHVSIAGGWIDLPSHTALDFYGFHVALQKLGFGSDPNGDRWIGFNGDINLVDGVSLGGSVQGMRINIDNGRVDFAGVSVDFAIPDVLSFSGEIEHIQLQAGDDPTKQGLPANFPTPANIFAGGVDISIEAAGNLEITGNFVVAQVPIGGVTQTAFFLALDAELPVGIPLFLDVALYGLEGLFALNLKPDPVSHGNTWWEWYKFPNDGGAGINVNGTPDYTATDANKWLNVVPGAFALGAGATIGTQDDGFTVSASIAFILMLPGPVISFIGKANILSKRIGGPSQEANFQAMATYDGNNSTFDLVVEAHYAIPVVLDIEATAELYVAPPDWYFALGKPPHDKRVHARIFDLFESDAYFVISQSGLVTGTWTGYRNSWSFGPLSASLDAYLATLAAIQWSPLQIAGGIELHGDVQLSAFGIHVGLTADALLEGTAPNPFWVHGEFSVELDLPWPLPNVGGTISLSWGGNDGPPPVPLALNTVSATTIDHQTGDRYELLAHRANAPRQAPSGLSVLYDSGTPGILAPQPAGYWSGIDPNVANDWWTVGPDLAPAQLAWAPLVPQDSHFTMTFAHGANDLYAGFAYAQPVPPDQAVVKLPGIVEADDMSNLNPTAPAVQWLIKHDLWEVALFQYAAGGWRKLAASPQHDAPYPLPGVWMTPDPTKNAGPPDSILKVTPFTLHVTDPVTASWSGVGSDLGTDFVDQGLHIQVAENEPAIAVSNGPFSSMPPGLLFESLDTAGAMASITFPARVQLLQVRAVMLGSGEFPILLPSFTADGAPLKATNSIDSSQIYTFTVDPNAAAISTLGINVADRPVLFVSVTYKRPDVRMPILPSAPGFYALKVTSAIGAGRPDSSGNATYQPAQDGSPVIEFAYFQCASGPGTAVLATPTPPPGATYPSPLPYELPPMLPQALAANPAANAFPLGGRLADLITYMQWSWPQDGSPAAYYGYDVSVEFNESYVHALYLAFGYGAVSPPYRDFELLQSLHLRCVDRNNMHTLLLPSAVAVPSIPQQSAVVAGVWNLQYPSTIAGDTPPSRPVIGSAGQLAGRLRLAASTRQFTSLTLDDREVSLLTQAAASRGVMFSPGALGANLQYNPDWGDIILHELEELQAAAQARALWFAPLQPRTRYTVDVVAGPLFNRARDGVAGGGSGLLQAIFTTSDAIGALAALQTFLAHEDALTTLARVQFATSRYALFEDHVANAVAQTNNAPAVPSIRRYAAPAAVTAAGWLADPANDDTNRQNNATTYLTARSSLLQMAASYDPMFDPLLPQAQNPPEPGDGRAALAANRADVQNAWGQFTTATSAIFDGLVKALNRADLVSNAKYVPPPDTEISLITTDNDTIVTAMVLESPEPLDWRRLWQWVTLAPANARSRPLPPPTVLWSSDGTRALIVPGGRPFGSYVLSLRFQGNLGPEVPCITLNGSGITGTADFGAIQFAPIHRRYHTGEMHRIKWGRP